MIDQIFPKNSFCLLNLAITELDVEKLKSVQTDLNKLSNVVENDVIKITTYDELGKKVSAIVSDKQSLEKKI